MANQNYLKLDTSFTLSSLRQEYAEGGRSPLDVVEAIIDALETVATQGPTSTLRERLLTKHLCLLRSRS